MSILDTNIGEFDALKIRLEGARTVVVGDSLIAEFPEVIGAEVLDLPRNLGSIYPEGLTGWATRKVILPDSAFLHTKAFVGSKVEEVIGTSGCHLDRDGSQFDSCMRLLKVHLKIGGERIPAWMFSNCLNLQKVVLEGPIKRIDRGAFEGVPIYAHIVIRTTYNRITLFDQMTRNLGLRPGCHREIDIYVPDPEKFSVDYQSGADHYFIKFNVRKLEELA